MKKLDMTFEDMVNLFYFTTFMSFIPKLHIFATRGQKSGFFSHFGQMVGLGPTPVGLRPTPVVPVTEHWP